MKMKKTYAKLLIFMAMAAALIGCPPTEEAVKISFSANGGVGTMADQDATVGMETTLNANEFDRAGYEFDGWNEAADGSGKSYADKGKITVSAAVKLYAQWKPAPLQNFEAVGANAAVILTWDLVQIPYEEISITYGGASEAVKVTPQNEPNDTVTISGLENDKEYTFTAVVTADGKTSREATVKGTPSLANSPVTVTFHSNPPADFEEQGSYTQVVEVDKETALTLCEFAVYESYEFKGWAKDPASKEIAFEDGAKLKATTEDITSGIHLYAVWAGIPLTGVTIPLPAGYLIGGTTVVLEEALEPANAYVSSVEVTVADSEETVNYDFATKTLTLPSNTTDVSVPYSVTLTYYTVNDSGEKTPVTASLSDLTVYPDTWVVFNDTVYKDVQVFDFTDTASLEGVRYDSAAISSDAISEEGFTFTVPTGNKQLTIPSDGLGTAVLTLIEMKWDKTGANVYIAQGNAIYGWSPYKGGDNFMLGLDVNNPTANRWNAKVGSSMDISPETGSFNKYFILDDGSNLPTLGFNNNTPYKTTVAITSKTDANKITEINPFNITFTVSQTENVTYTLKTVAFYTSTTP